MARKRIIPLGRHFWAVVLRFLIWLLLRVEVRGLEGLPRTGPGLIYFNHIHWLDPVLICGRLPRYAVPLTKVEASRWPLLGWVLRWYHVIFIRRGEVDRTALTAAWGVLRDGDIVIISPEGTRSRSGALQRAKEGLAFVGREVPLAWWMPCAVVGTPEFEFKPARMIRRPRVTITFGQPFRIRWPEGQLAPGEKSRVGREALREMTDEAMAELALLLPPGMRGDYVAEDSVQRTWQRTWREPM